MHMARNMTDLKALTPAGLPGATIIKIEKLLKGKSKTS